MGSIPGVSSCRKVKGRRAPVAARTTAMLRRSIAYRRGAGKVATIFPQARKNRHTRRIRSLTRARAIRSNRPTCPGGGIGRRAGFRCQWLNGREGSILSWAPGFAASRLRLAQPSLMLSARKAVRDAWRSSSKRSRVCRGLTIHLSIHLLGRPMFLQLSSSAKADDPVNAAGRALPRRRGVLDARLRGHDRENVATASSRRCQRPSFASQSPSKPRGRREGRVFATPMARLQTKSRRQSPQVWPQHPAFPARWF